MAWQGSRGNGGQRSYGSGGGRGYQGGGQKQYGNSRGGQQRRGSQGGQRKENLPIHFWSGGYSTDSEKIIFRARVDAERIREMLANAEQDTQQPGYVVMLVLAAGNNRTNADAWFAFAGSEEREQNEDQEDSRPQQRQRGGSSRPVGNRKPERQQEQADSQEIPVEDDWDK